MQQIANPPLAPVRNRVVRKASLRDQKSPESVGLLWIWPGLLFHPGYSKDQARPKDFFHKCRLFRLLKVKLDGSRP